MHWVFWQEFVSLCSCQCTPQGCVSLDRLDRRRFAGQWGIEAPNTGHPLGMAFKQIMRNQNRARQHLAHMLHRSQVTCPCEHSLMCSFLENPNEGLTGWTLAHNCRGWSEAANMWTIRRSIWHLGWCEFTYRRIRRGWEASLWSSVYVWWYEKNI